MKKKILFVVLSILIAFVVINPKTTLANSGEYLYLGGIPAGFTLNTRGASVVGLTDVITKDGLKSPAKDAGIEVGDLILSINGIDVNNAEDISKSLKSSKELVVDIKRKCEQFETTITPAQDLTKNYKLGVFIKDSVSGIGTITYILGDKIASLGHPVVDENGELMDIIGGNIFSCDINGYKKGERGMPGELHGYFSKSSKIGNINKNTIYGVYGAINKNDFDYSKLIKIEKGSAEVGKASIFTTIEGDLPKEYSVSIVKTDTFSDTKNLVIKINDKKLLDTTGGIVQGMSGSPIVQNGKLVGAVTHVFINDPTRGFGISIENMINN